MLAFVHDFRDAYSYGVRALEELLAQRHCELLLAQHALPAPSD